VNGFDLTLSIVNSPFSIIQKGVLRMQVTYILMLVFAVIIALFAAFNGGPVNINFLFAQIELPQAVVIIGSAAIGAILGYSFDLIKRIKSTLRIKELEKQNKNLTKELDSLRATPVIETQPEESTESSVELTK